MAQPQPPPAPQPVVPPTSAPMPAPTSVPPPQRSQPPRTPPVPGAGALQEESLKTFLIRMDRKGQALLDSVAPYKLQRWLGLVALVAIFMIRMVLLEGFYIVAYVLFIFILNQFILFLQPKDRASLIAKAAAPAADPEEAAPLPTTDGEEFRPFVRRLPEFKFWYSTTYATVLAFCATFFKTFDVPVFWPVLLFYFIILFITTMRRQWLDMKKLKYVPWDIGSKKVYKSDPKRVSVTRPSVKPDVVAASGRAPPAPVPTVNVATKKPNPPSSGAASSVASAPPAQN